jgi:hypothetical protein
MFDDIFRDIFEEKVNKVPSTTQLENTWDTGKPEDIWRADVWKTDQKQ